MSSNDPHPVFGDNGIHDEITRMKLQKSRKEARLQMGEAHAICSQCGSRLYSFHGDEDKGKRCPYNGKGC